MAEYDEIPTAADDVLEQIHAARAEIEAIIDELSQEQMTEATDDGGWSIKDHLAHIAEWQNRALGVIEGVPAWEAMGIEQEKFQSLDIDGINEIVYERNRDRSFPDVLTEFRKTQERVILTVEQMNEDDLDREIPAHIHGKDARVLDIVQGYFTRHDQNHVEDIRQLANQPAN